MQAHGTCTSTPLTLTLRVAAISRTAYLSAASPSRALRSLPLSVMMSGDYIWHTGTLYGGGTHGFFWASMPGSYTHSRDIYFGSSNFYPMDGRYKPYGCTLRCVARNHQKPHPYSTSNNFSELSSALQILCTISSRALRSLPLSVMMSGYYDWHNGNSDWGAKNGRGVFWVSTSDSYTNSRVLYFYSIIADPKRGNHKSSGFTIRCVARLKKRFVFFQSSPQPSSFGYDVGHSLLGQWSSRQ